MTLALTLALTLTRLHTQAPGQRLWLDSRHDRTPTTVNLQRALWACPVWLAAFLLIAAATYTSHPPHSSGTVLPAFVHVQLGDDPTAAVDVRLNWTAGYTVSRARVGVRGDCIGSWVSGLGSGLETIRVRKS